jgi:regulator of sigma E protease
MGLRHGDRILDANGTPVHSAAAIRTIIERGKPVTLVVRRGGKTVTLGPATPQRQSDGTHLLGFVFALQRVGTVNHGAIGALRASWGDVSFITRETFSAIRDRFTQGNANGLTTPVGIVQQSSTTVNEGVYPRLLAWISLSLAIFNMLPFLPLDGGHILFALIELARRKPVRREVYERVSAIGIAAMLMLFFVGLSNDIGRITSGPQITP